ncbi:unnamed protein product [Periconia digitata]|uniref:Uncharacterized protein n=1 Tax=Periconia digitata TaxID=1303443 RepID=A0A9W4XTM4_9PLEO|nr:unnamed protein product [Periconia digitata]
MASPSEFLTFYRRAVLSSSSSSRVLRSAARTSAPLRQFGASTQCYKENLSTDSSAKTDQFPDDEHTVNKVSKGDTLDIRSSNTKDAIKSQGKSGGHATEGRDSAGGVAKAKREHPEAPDPAIGMQDERGGRGG